MTRLSRLLPPAALLAALGAAGAATAQDGPMSGGPGGFGHGGHGGRTLDVAAIDANGDGSLDRAELVARSAERLALLDLDSDGALDRAELIAAFPAQSGFDVFSANPAEGMAVRILALNGATAAGRVEVAVLSEAQVNMLLTRLDADRDDAISAAEAEAPMGRHAEHGDHDGKDGHRRGPRF